jgi:purine-binding chemotaxis protein CheW
MSATNQLVVFTLDDQSYALRLGAVHRIVRAVEVTRIPDAPDYILGVINVEGEVLPVFNTRKRLGLPTKDIDVQDLFIIVREGGKAAALVADDVKPVQEVAGGEFVDSGGVMPHSAFTSGMAKMEDGMIILLRTEAAFTLDQSHALPASAPIEGS